MTAPGKPYIIEVEPKRIEEDLPSAPIEEPVTEPVPEPEKVPEKV